MRVNPDSRKPGSAKTGFAALLLIFYTVFVSAFYQLVIRPLTLDYSFLGFVAVGVLVLLSYYAFPKHARLRLAILTLSVLFIEYGVQRILDDSVAWRILEFPLLFVLIGGLARLLGKIQWRSTFLIVLVLAIVETLVPLSQIDYYQHFTVSSRSDALDPTPMMPFYPIAKSGSDLYTLGELPTTSKQNQKELDDLVKQKKQLDPDTYQTELTQMYKAHKQVLDVLHMPASQVDSPVPTKKAEFAKLPFADFGLAGVPTFVASWSTDASGAVKQQLAPAAGPEQFLSDLFNPLEVPITNAQRVADAIGKSQQNWSQFVGRPVPTPVTDGVVIGEGQLLPGQGRQVLVEANNQLSLYPSPLQAHAQPLATLKGTWDAPYSSDVVIADIDGDGQDELLANTVPAQILKFAKDGSSKVIWQSSKESFRFEFVQPDGTKHPQIVVNDPSVMRDQPTRYLSGYRWDGQTLTRSWRTYKTNNIHPFALTADQWVAQEYGVHRFYVLKPLPFNIQLVLGVIAVLLLLFGYGMQLFGRRKQTCES